MDAFDVICKFAKEHGMSYGYVAALLQAGSLTYEQLGLSQPKELPQRSEIYKQTMERLEKYAAVEELQKATKAMLNNER